MLRLTHKESKPVEKIRKTKGYKIMSEDELLKKLIESKKPKESKRLKKIKESKKSKE